MKFVGDPERVLQILTNLLSNAVKFSPPGATAFSMPSSRACAERLADIASALIVLDESGGTPSALLTDAADLQRYVADRHGGQRARLGWTREALNRESAILREEHE